MRTAPMPSMTDTSGPEPVTVTLVVMSRSPVRLLGALFPVVLPSAPARIVKLGNRRCQPTGRPPRPRPNSGFLNRRTQRAEAEVRRRALSVEVGVGRVRGIDHREDRGCTGRHDRCDNENHRSQDRSHRRRDATAAPAAARVDACHASRAPPPRPWSGDVRPARTRTSRAPLGDGAHGTAFGDVPSEPR